MMPLACFSATPHTLAQSRLKDPAMPIWVWQVVQRKKVAPLSEAELPPGVDLAGAKIRYTGDCVPFVRAHACCVVDEREVSGVQPAHGGYEYDARTPRVLLRRPLPHVFFGAKHGWRCNRGGCYPLPLPCANTRRRSFAVECERVRRVCF